MHISLISFLRSFILVIFVSFGIDLCLCSDIVRAFKIFLKKCKKNHKTNKEIVCPSNFWEIHKCTWCAPHKISQKSHKLSRVLSQFFFPEVPNSRFGGLSPGMFGIKNVHLETKRWFKTHVVCSVRQRNFFRLSPPPPRKKNLNRQTSSNSQSLIANCFGATDLRTLAHLWFFSGTKILCVAH